MIIGAIACLVAAGLFLVLAAVSLSWLGLLAGLGMGGIGLSLLSLGSLIAAAVSIVLAYGLWRGSGWAWTWTLIFSIVGLIGSIIALTAGIGIVGVATYAILIYYLTRGRVKAFYRKGTAQANSISQTEPLRQTVQAFCTHCGQRVSGEAFCPTCGSSTTVMPNPSAPLSKASHAKRNVLAIVIVVLLIGIFGASIHNNAAQTGTAANTTPLEKQYDVVIRYTEKYANSISYHEPEQGYTYLILTVQIQNNIDKELNVGPQYFSIIVNNVKYDTDFATYSLPDTLKSVTVLKGGVVTGSLAFEVPAGTTAYTPTFENPFAPAVQINWLHY
jgi:hypothetical protein